MLEPLVDARGLEIRYGERVALALDRFEVRRGELVALLGANGSGKTTLLKALGGLVPLARGSVEFDGRPLSEDAPRRAHRVYVHQAPYLLAGSVFRNVAFGLRASARDGGRPAREELRARVADALGAVGLAGFERRAARELSGGESQRVALARALVLEPELLLLDEPTAAADAASRPLVLDALRASRARSTLAVVFSTHDEPLARELADRVVRLPEAAK